MDKINRYDNPELFEQAVVFYTSSLPELNIEGIASFIILVQRDPNYIGFGNYTAYHYLGYLFHSMENIEIAIELYSKGIELTPEEPSIIENRGFCFLIKNDLKNALNDFEKAKKLNGGCHSDLANIIDDIKIRQRGLKGNGKNYHQSKNLPKTIYELIEIPPEAFDLTA